LTRRLGTTVMCGWTFITSIRRNAGDVIVETMYFADVTESLTLDLRAARAVVRRVITSGQFCGPNRFARHEYD